MKAYRRYVLGSSWMGGCCFLLGMNSPSLGHALGGFVTDGLGIVEADHGRSWRSSFPRNLADTDHLTVALGTREGPDLE